MTDSDGAGRDGERTWTVPVYEDHLTFLGDIVRDGAKARAARRRRRPHLQARLQSCLWRLCRGAFRRQGLADVEIRRI